MSAINVGVERQFGNCMLKKNKREAQRRFVEGSIVWAFHPIVQVQPWLKVRYVRNWQRWMVSMPDVGMCMHVSSQTVCGIRKHCCPSVTTDTGSRSLCSCGYENTGMERVLV